MEHNRCPWLPVRHELYREYHDHEWGVPSRDRRYLFEMLCLEGAQAGLSWWTILQRRARYREVFQQFAPEAVALLTDAQLEHTLLDPGVIRHRGKVYSVRTNARAWLALEARVGSVSDWIWNFVGGEPRVNKPLSMADVPSQTPESRALSKALREAGFAFVGPTTMYAFMQAVGMVNDHTADCMCSENQSS